MFIQITKNWIQGTNVPCKINLIGDEALFEKYGVSLGDEFYETVANDDRTHTEEVVFFGLERNEIYTLKGFYFDDDKWSEFGNVKVTPQHNENDIDFTMHNSMAIKHGGALIKD